MMPQKDFVFQSESKSAVEIDIDPIFILLLRLDLCDVIRDFCQFTLPWGFPSKPALLLPEPALLWF